MISPLTARMTASRALLFMAAGFANSNLGADDAPLPTAIQRPQPAGNRDWPQWGGSSHRNNVAEGYGIPVDWNIETGKNIKWSVPLGSQTYGNPVVANGKVFVGTNNGHAYLPHYSSYIDLGVLLCFRESDGKFLWQYSSQKLATGRVHDWPLQGICSAPCVEGDRLWFVTNRGEVVCLDTEGFRDGEDDGPVLGRWSRKFRVASNMKSLADALDANKLDDDRKISTENRLTLEGLIARAGLTKSGHEITVKPAGPQQQWIVSHGRGEPLCRITFREHTIRIQGVREDRDHDIEAELDLLSGLDDGRISLGLAALLQLKTEPSPPGKATVVKSGKSWTIRGMRDDRPAEYQLELAGDLLVVEHLTPPLDEADVVWSFDMMKELGVSQHNMATCAPTIRGDILFICTSNGVAEDHRTIPAPKAPSFLALDKRTGKVLWTDNSPGTNILHGQWSCPAVGEFDGVPQVIFGGGDGWLYSFRADRWEGGKPELLWKFDANPKDSEWILGGRGTRNELIAVPVIYAGRIYAAVGQDPEHGEGVGHLWCIDPTKRGDVSPTLVLDGNSKEPIPHRREQAFVEWKPLFSSSEWQFEHGLSDGKVSEALRAEFQKRGTPLPEKVEVQPNPRNSKARYLTSRDWILAGMNETQAVRMRLVRDFYYIDQKTGKARGQVTAYVRTTETEVPNPNSAVVWHYSGFDLNGDGKLDFEEEMHRAIGSPAIKDDLLFISDFSGLVHCLDAKTGKLHWTFDLLAACWTTPLIVDDKVYVGDEDGDVAIFPLTADPGQALRKTITKTPKGPEVVIESLHSVSMVNSIYTVPVSANNVLFIARKDRLFAIEAEKMNR